MFAKLATPKTSSGSFLLSNKVGVIYTRISVAKTDASGKYSKYNTSVSLENQADACKSYADILGISIAGSPYKEIGSAYNDKRNILLNLTNDLKNCNLLCYDASRFSRNTEIADEYLRAFIKNNVRVVFVHEKFMISAVEHIPKALEYIKKAQEESLQTSRRIHNANVYRHLRSFIQTGGTVPYGYTVSGFGRKQLIVNKNEHKIQKVIGACRECSSINHLSMAALNGLVGAVSKLDMSRDPIKMYSRNLDTKVESEVKFLTQPMSWSDIMKLLNEYSVPYRTQSRWYLEDVKFAYRTYSPIEDELDLESLGVDDKDISDDDEKYDEDFFEEEDVDMAPAKKSDGKLPAKRTTKTSSKAQDIPQPQMNTNQNMQQGFPQGGFMPGYPGPVYMMQQPMWGGYPGFPQQQGMPMQQQGFPQQQGMPMQQGMGQMPMMMPMMTPMIPAFSPYGGQWNQQNGNNGQ